MEKLLNRDVWKWVSFFNFKLFTMKPGSLVTPRWPEEVMVVKIAELIGSWAIKAIIGLPEYGQLYTVASVSDVCPCCNRCTCMLEEMRVFAFNKGLYEDFYVEVDPPQENVQSIVEDILINELLVQTNRKSAEPKIH